MAECLIRLVGLWLCTGTGAASGSSGWNAGLLCPPEAGKGAATVDISRRLAGGNNNASSCWLLKFWGIDSAASSNTSATYESLQEPSCRWEKRANYIDFEWEWHHWVLRSRRTLGRVQQLRVALRPELVVLQARDAAVAVVHDAEANLQVPVDDPVGLEVVVVFA
jgi:hypothetical protein